MPESEVAFRQTSKDEAMAAIEIIIGECSQMGANDFEIPALRGLEDQVRDGTIEPEEAVRQAESIRAAKQDYH